MKILKLLLIPILLCFGIINIYGQDVEIPFSWVSAAPSTNSSVGLFQCGSMNINLNTGGTQHNLLGTSAFFPSAGPLNTPITLSFSKPVCNLGVLVRDLDEGSGAPSEWLEFTGLPLPSGFTPSVGGSPFTYIGVTADPNGLPNTEAWVNWDGPLTSVTFDYNKSSMSWNMYLDSLRFDCDCGVPEDLNCCYGNGWQTLTWAEVPGAVGYDVQFGFNDPTSGCCDTVTGMPSGWMEWMLTDNVFLVPASFPDCFWWRVRSVFSDGSRSEWSEKMCDCNEPEVIPCVTPINLDCEIETSAGTRTISWDPVVGALGYSVSITYNDPACCPTGVDPVSTTEVSTTSTFLSGISPNECFSWKVRTICTDAPTYSEWSESKCSSDCYFPVAKASSSGRVEVVDGDDVKSSLLEMTLVPNPANEFVTITVYDDGDAATYENTVLSITDISGTEVYRDDMTINTPKGVELKNLKPGLYLCKVINGDHVLSSSKLVIK